MGKSVRKVVDSSFFEEELPPQEEPKAGRVKREVDSSFFAEELEPIEPVKKKVGGGAAASASAEVGSAISPPSESGSILPPTDPISSSFDFLSAFIDKNAQITPEDKQSILTGNGDALAAFAKEQKNRIKNTEGALTDQLTRFYQESTNKLGDMSGQMRRQGIDRVAAVAGQKAKAEAERPSTTDPAMVALNEAQKEAIKKEKKDFNDNLFPVASIIAYENVPEKTPKAIGKRVRELTAEDGIDRENRYEQKGIDLRPDQKAYNDVVGLNAMETAIQAKMNAVTEETPQEVRDEVLRDAQRVQELRKSHYKEHREFYQGQIAKLIGDEIYKEKNTLQLITGAYNITEDDINRIGTKLGFTKEELQGIEDDDIPNEALLGRFYYNFIAKPATDLNNLGNRIWGAATGGDVDAITADNERRSMQKAAEYATPNAQLFQQAPTKVDTDRKSGTFLLDVPETKPSTFNKSFVPIATVVADGFGQILNYGLGAKGVGGALQGLKLVKSADKAAAIGNFAYTFSSTYEDNYQAAARFTDDPVERNLYATLKSTATAASEQILPDYQIVNRAFGRGAMSPKGFLDYIEKTGIQNVTKDGLKGFLKASIQGAGDVGKEVAEEELDLLAEVTLNSMIIPKANEGRNLVDEMISTGVVSGISAALPVGYGAFRQQRQQDQNKDNLLHHIGSNAGAFRAEIQKMKDEGVMNATEADRKIQIINTLDRAVQLSEDVPIENQPKYAGNLLQTALIKEEIKQAEGDDAKISMLNSELQRLINEQTDLRTPREKGATTAAATATATAAPQAGATAAAAPAPSEDDTAEATTFVNELVSENLIPDVFHKEAQKDPMGFLKMVADQAQNVSATGQTNVTESPEQATRKTFGDSVVDYAMSLFPATTTAAPAAAAGAAQPSADDEEDFDTTEGDAALAEMADTKAKGMADSLIKIESTFNNAGYTLMTDFDDEVSLIDKKTGKPVEPGDLPRNLLDLAGQYEEGLRNLAQTTDSMAAMAEARSRFLGEETEAEVVPPAAIPAPPQAAPETSPEEIQTLFNEKMPLDIKYRPVSVQDNFSGQTITKSANAVRTEMIKRHQSLEKLLKCLNR